MMRNTTRRKTSIVPQNMEDPTKPRAQKPEIEEVEITPSNFRLERIKIIKRNLTPRRNSPEEYEKVLM